MDDHSYHPEPFREPSGYTDVERCENDQITVKAEGIHSVVKLCLEAGASSAV